MPAARAFFAVWPDAAAGAALRALAGEVAGRMAGRAPPGDNLHLTVAFVGQVRADRLPLLEATGDEAAAGAAPFVLTLDCVGTFPGSGIVWAGATSAPPGIERLAALLRDGLSRRRFEVEARPFHPHVTLARRCRRPGEFAIFPPIGWTVSRLVLNASQLSAGPPGYAEIASWRLGR